MAAIYQNKPLSPVSFFNCRNGLCIPKQNPRTDLLSKTARIFVNWKPTSVLPVLNSIHNSLRCSSWETAIAMIITTVSTVLIIIFLCPVSAIFFACTKILVSASSWLHGAKRENFDRIIICENIFARGKNQSNITQSIIVHTFCSDKSKKFIFIFIYSKEISPISNHWRSFNDANSTSNIPLSSLCGCFDVLLPINVEQNIYSPNGAAFCSGDQTIGVFFVGVFTKLFGLASRSHLNYGSAS